MKILVGGDLFLHSALFMDLLRDQLGTLGIAPEFVVLDSDWPRTPLQYSDELHEFVGDAEEVAELAQDVEVIVTHLLPISAVVIENARALRAIACSRTGPVNVNVAVATARGIPVIYAPGRNADAVAEFTLGLILAELKGIARAHADLRSGVWREDLYVYENTGHELRGQVVGLVGCGAIGSRVAKLLQPFGVEVLAADPYKSDAFIASVGASKVDLPALLARSDIVSLHARVTDETRGMIGANELAQMKRGSYLINTARGPLLDDQAVVQALESGHLAGAAFDTYNIEPLPPDSPLLRLPNVTLAPHIAGATQQSAHTAAHMIVQDLVNLLRGEPLDHCLNAAELAAQ